MQEAETVESHEQKTILVYMARSCLKIKRRRGRKIGKERGVGEMGNSYPRNCYAIYYNLYIKRIFFVILFFVDFY